jgi:hypothetical protein
VPRRLQILLTNSLGCALCGCCIAPKNPARNGQYAITCASEIDHAGELNYDNVKNARSLMTASRVTSLTILLFALWISGCARSCGYAPVAASRHNGPFTINEMIIYGQSLGAGHLSMPVVNPDPAYENALMFNPGIRPIPDRQDPDIVLDGRVLTGFIPLAEADSEDGDGQTIGAGLSWSVVDTVGDYTMLVCSDAVGNQPYPALAKGTQPYRNLLTQVSRAVAVAAPNVVNVRGVAFIHGESDFLAGTSKAVYEADLANLQSDLNVDIKAITRQTSDVVLFTDQMESYTAAVFAHRAAATSVIPLAQLNTSVEHPGKVILVTPKYILDYVRDGVHLTATSEEILGEFYAKAYVSTIIEGRPWEPLRPVDVSISGKQVTIDYHVPAAPLVLDTSLVSNPGNYGYTYDDDSASPPTITQVSLAGPARVRLTLSAAPEAAPGHRHLSYAYKGRVGSPAGPRSGPRGNLHDSDPAISRWNARPLPNYSVAFDWSL